MLRLTILSLLVASFHLETTPFPIQFSIPERKIVENSPIKYKDFAFIMPGDFQTYIYNQEADYYADYQRSYYAITTKKGGWDCMRHYEILANGCIPYFLNLEECPPNTLTFFPKDLILEAMHLDGVSYLTIDHSKFDKCKYYEILNQLIEYTREHLTTKKIAEYVLNKLEYAGQGKILFLSNDLNPDYLRCLTLIGLKELIGDRVVDIPKIEHIYQNYPNDLDEFFGKGDTYTKTVKDLSVDRENIEERIKAREFDLVIYGSLHRGLRYHDLVQQYYTPSEIAYLCGEDEHECNHSLNNLFLREYGATTECLTYEQMAIDPYTDHVKLFRELFQIEKIHSFLEFGLGQATKYFLDQCETVFSIELIVENRKELIEPWYKKSLALFKNYLNWHPSTHHFSLDFDQADQRAQLSLDPETFDRTYLLEIDQLCDRIFQNQHFDLVFVDPGILIRGDLVNALFDRVDIIAAHDTACTLHKMFGYYKIKTPDNYMKLSSRYGSGTTFWIKKEKKELIEKLRDRLPDLE